MDAAIRTAALTKRFGSRTAVDGLDLEVRSGEIFGFLGPNGAGKSTTIRLLLGLIRPNGGQAHVLGCEVARQRLQVAGRVGALVEAPAFYDHLSGRQNLEILARLSGGSDRRRLDHVLELVRLTDRQRDKVSGYSHGMRQRLGIAQALLPRPELVILDEPATGLDPQGLVEVRELMRHLRDEEGMTIFLSSHLLHEVELLCSHVAVISEGRMIAHGTVSELLSRLDSRVEVAVDDPMRAAEVVGHLPYVDNLVVSDGVLQVVLDPERAADLNEALVTAGLKVSALAPARSTLEETYLTLMAEQQDDSRAAR
jgi:ABC-2 type transport system ATP-binding protein